MNLLELHNRVMNFKINFVWRDSSREDRQNTEDTNDISQFSEMYKTWLNEGNYYQWLHLAVKVLKPKNILELGTANGTATWCMFTAKEKETFVTTIDIADNFKYMAQDMIDGNYSFIHGDTISSKIMHELRLKNMERSIDFLFIDSHHIYSHITQEWALYQQFLTDESLVIVDDINHNDMRKFWDEIEYEKLDISSDCHYSGFGIFNFVRQK